MAFKDYELVILDYELVKTLVQSDWNFRPFYMSFDFSKQKLAVISNQGGVSLRLFRERLESKESKTSRLASQKLPTPAGISERIMSDVVELSRRLGCDINVFTSQAFKFFNEQSVFDEVARITDPAAITYESLWLKANPFCPSFTESGVTYITSNYQSWRLPNDGMIWAAMATQRIDMQPCQVAFFKAKYPDQGIIKAIKNIGISHFQLSDLPRYE